MPVPAQRSGIEHPGLIAFVAVCFLVLLFLAVRAHREQLACEAFCEASGESVKAFVPERGFDSTRCSCQ